MALPVRVSLCPSTGPCSTSGRPSSVAACTCSFQRATLHTHSAQASLGRHRLSVRSSATAVKERARPGEKKGFVEEMRMAAMKLHTRDQSPREGQRSESENPVQQFTPTREGYLRFLAESKAVYDVLEKVVQEAPKAEYAQFRHTGLERAAPLARDISWMQTTYSLALPVLSNDGPGSAYARMLKHAAAEDPSAFICHFYNFYFAHTAGGKMIGRKVSDMILDGTTLDFYKWEGDVKEKLSAVKDDINTLAESWTRQQKDHCLEETHVSFRYSGDILRTIISQQ